MSFFDDDEPPTAIRTPSTGAPRASRPRSPAPSARAHRSDRQTFLVRRSAVAVAVVVLIVVIVVAVAGCERSAAKVAIFNYTKAVNSIVGGSQQAIAVPFFDDLGKASGKSAIDISVDLYQLQRDATQDLQEAEALSVPSQLTSAHDDLLLALNLRAKALGKVAGLITTALGTTNAQTAITQIAGEMELILASDVVYAQLVVPLITDALDNNDITGIQPASSRWLTDFSWLEASTVATDLTGVSGTGSLGQPLAPGTHGHALSGVSVGSTQLATGDVVNHIASGPNPTFVVGVLNDSSNSATDVKVQVTVTALGRTFGPVTTVLAKTTPSATPFLADVTLKGVPLNEPATVTANIEAVPGEKNLDNNKGVYTAIFSSP